MRTGVYKIQRPLGTNMVPPQVLIYNQGKRHQFMMDWEYWEPEFEAHGMPAKPFARLTVKEKRRRSTIHVHIEEIVTESVFEEPPA